MTWVATQGAEGTGSIEQAITVPTGNALRVTPENAPSGVTGWNVYVGPSSGETTRQNSDPLDPETAWVMPDSGLASGNPIEDGQLPEAFKTVPRFLQRG